MTKALGKMWILLLVLCGCGQVERPAKLYPEKLQNGEFEQFEIEYNAAMRFREGYLTEFQITGFVPNPGTPLLTVEKLPKGARFDASTGRVSWQPSIGTLQGKKYEIFEVLIVLTSSANPGLRLRREAILILEEAGS